MIRKDFKYKKIKNFLTSDELILLKDYCIIKHREKLLYMVIRLWNLYY